MADGEGRGMMKNGFVDPGGGTPAKARAERLGGGLPVTPGLWHGQPFHYNGKHYHITETKFMPPPPPIQKPRIPIWVVGAWPREKSMQRVIRYDGLLPTKMNTKGKHVKFKPADIRAMKAYLDEHRRLKT